MFAPTMPPTASTTSSLPRKRCIRLRRGGGSAEVTLLSLVTGEFMGRGLLRSWRRLRRAVGWLRLLYRLRRRLGVRHWQRLPCLAASPVEEPDRDGGKANR